MTRSTTPAAVLAVVLVLAVVGALNAPAPAAPGTTRTADRAIPRGPDRAFLGYKIPRHANAASGFIGSRRLPGDRVVYRTDPRRKAPVGGFVRARWTGNFTSSAGHRVGRSRTACAAQLLSYGRTQTLPRNRRLQAAGIDVAVMHLLYGRAFKHHGGSQVRRTNQVSQGPTIRAFAQNLVEDYCPLSGPYAVSLVPDRTTVDLGDEVTYTVTVRSARGRPFEGARVLVTPPTTSGYEVRTGPDGTATFTVTATTAGPTSTSSVTRKLPPVRVRYLVPRTRGASRVAVAGREQGRAYPRSSTIAVRARPRVSLDPDRPVTRGREFRLRFGLASGYPGGRTAAVQVVGPMPSRDARCDEAGVVRTVQIPVSANGGYATTPLTLNRAGRYLWRVTVPADSYNQRISKCGGGFSVAR